MRALIPDPTCTGNVRFSDVADITEIGPDQVLIEVTAFSVNRGETFLLEDPADDWRPGKDVAGTVVANGNPDSGPNVGARVVAHPPSGGWAERVVVDKESVCELPDNLSDVDAAALPLAGITAIRLARRAGFAAGTDILITGASGGVGHHLTQLLGRVGAHVTVVVRDESRGAELRGYGADVRTSVPEDKAFDIVYESVGGATFSSAASTLRPGGKLVWFGQASKEPVTINFFDFLTGAPEVVIEHFSYAEEGPYTSDLSTLVELAAAGTVTAHVGVVSDWCKTGEVLENLVDRQISGSAVLQIERS
ncbi:zinc-binding dehydrogenase [Corynebacterium bovis]|uniref:zinc-binding dehydrogenase n=1 Tax=Corynebacterium bovis TaxID=36808 RepID=UPI003139AD12